MDENSLTRKEILDYLAKRIDRELSRSQRNGMTIWALLGGIGIVVFQLANLLPIVIKEEHLKDVAILFTCWVNLIISVWNIILFVIETQPERQLLVDYIYLDNLKNKSIIQTTVLIFLISLNYYICLIGNVSYIAINGLFIVAYLINLTHVLYYGYVTVKNINLLKREKIIPIILRPVPIWFFSKYKNFRDGFYWTWLFLGILGTPFIADGEYFTEHNVMDVIKVAILLIGLCWLVINTILQYVVIKQEKYILTQESALMTSDHYTEYLIFQIKELFGDADILDLIRYQKWVICKIKCEIMKNKYMKFSIIEKNVMKNKDYKIAVDLLDTLKTYSANIIEIEEMHKYSNKFHTIDTKYKKDLQELMDLIDAQKKDINIMLNEITTYMDEVELNIK